MPPTDRSSQRQALRQLNDWPTRAIILAAGRGKRLAPFTNLVPKPLLKVNGQPMLASILEALHAAAVSNVCLVTHYLAEQIVAFAGDGHRWNLHIEYRRQSSLLGTADALRTASSFMSEPTLVLAADYVLPRNYLRALKDGYQGSQSDVYASLKKMTPEEMERRNGLRFDNRGRVIEIVEKPAPGAIQGNVGASLIYVLPPELATYLAQIEPSRRGEYEITDALNAMLADGYVMDGVFQEAPGEWQAPFSGW